MEEKLIGYGNLEMETLRNIKLPKDKLKYLNMLLVDRLDGKIPSIRTSLSLNEILREAIAIERALDSNSIYNK